jgi:hypothetical protein
MFNTTDVPESVRLALDALHEARAEWEMAESIFGPADPQTIRAMGEYLALFDGPFTREWTAAVAEAARGLARPPASALRPTRREYVGARRLGMEVR